MSCAGAGQPGCWSLVIEGGIEVEQCVVEKNTVLLTGSFVLPEIFVQAGEIEDCCKACAGEKQCNAWNYCINTEGCEVPDLFDDSASSRALLNATVPEQSCILLSKKPSSEVSEKGKQSTTDYFSGQIQRKFLPSIAGYSTNSGKNISDSYDYTCAYSPKKKPCEVSGSVSEVSSMCSADSRCRGFVYGVNSSGNGDTIAVLKGGDANMDLFSDETMVDDPSWTVYALTEQGLEAQQVDQESSSSSVDLWIILISVLGGVLVLSILVVTITFAVMTKRYTKAMQDHQEASLQIIDGHSCQMMENETSSSDDVMPTVSRKE